MVTRVLLTRPETGAARTAAKLIERGFAPMVLPLTEVQPTGASLPAGVFNLVAVTSANAVRMADAALLAALCSLPAVAVGTRTAAAVRATGFNDVEEAGGTADLLADRLLMRTDEQARIAYLCGCPRKPALEARLRQSGRVVTAIETYCTIRLPVAAPQREVLQRDGFDAALVYSAQGAAALANLLNGLDDLEWRRAAFVCLSADVAQALPAGLSISVAERPDEPSLLACLDRLF